MLQAKQLFFTTLVLLLLDSLWLGFFGKQFYLDALGFLMPADRHMTTTNYAAASLAYLALIIGITFFVLPKANGDVLDALGFGALFGLICYGVYNCTNLAIIAGWPVWISIIDVVWGCILCAVTSFAVAWVR